jgi:hypothetical protein
MLRAYVSGHAAAACLALGFALLDACHSTGDDDHADNAGSTASGGTSSSGTGGQLPATGGSTSSGGSSTGGTGTATGGTGTGGSNNMGGSNATGGTGTATGGTGTATGGTGTAGSSTGGTSTASGGTGTAGSATSTGGANAAGGSSPTGGAAGTSGGTAGTGANPCDSALFCDDFESYSSAPNGKWTLRTTSGAAVAIDQSQHVSGSQSVKFTTPSGSSVTSFIRIQDASIFPPPNDTIYGRMMYRVEAEPTQSVHWTMIAGLGLVPGQSYHSEYRYGGQMPVTAGSQLMANYETPDWYSNKSTPGSDCWHHSNARVIKAATWTCVEWKFDGQANGMQMWLDGMAADDLTIMGHGDGCVNAANDFTWTAPSFASLDLGWESYQQDDPRTAYIDDVVLSTTKIGCP